MQMTFFKWACDVTTNLVRFTVLICCKNRIEGKNWTGSVKRLFYHNSCIRQPLNVNDYPVCVPIRKRRNGATNIEKINQLGVPSRADNRYRKLAIVRYFSVFTELVKKGGALIFMLL